MVSAIFRRMLHFDPSPSSAIVNNEVDRLLRQVVRVRVAVAPVFASVLLYLVLAETEVWRRQGLLLVMLVGVVFMVWSGWRTRQGRVGERELQLSVLATGPLQLFAITLTGGLDSPLLLFVPPFIVLSALLFGLGPWLGGLLVVELLWVAGLMGLQGLDGSALLTMPALGEVSTTRRLLMGLCVPVALLASTAVGLSVRARIHSMVEVGLRSRQRELESLVAHSRDLELAGGELAHELKNPLASIQGLAMLVSRGLANDPKNAERMDVLRGEVTRMTSIVDGFLTWSRPMTPLTRSTVDGAALLERMRVLHEGMALAADVRVVCTSEPVTLEADERKLEQVLVNLIQNALAAAERRTVVELSVRREGLSARFEVADRGPGIDPELLERVFEPGVTTGTNGSGLGLTVARMLARQHGGELALASRVGGGTVASLEVPCDPS